MGSVFGSLESGRHQSQGKWLHNVEIVFPNGNLKKSCRNSAKAAVKENNFSISTLLFSIQSRQM
jgi:hypothetical protein